MNNSLTKGVVYVATGDRYIRESIASAESVKRLDPDMPIAVFSEQKLTSPVFDLPYVLERPQRNFFDKILAMSLSPFDQTIFLDTDTIALTSLVNGFALLDRFDIAAAHEPARYLYPIGGVPDEFPEINTGVVLYRKNAETDLLFDQWYRFYEEEKFRKEESGMPLWHDQLSFTRALWQSQVSFYALPPEWNYRAPFPQFLSGAVRIWHGRMRKAENNLDFVNRDTTGRLMNPNPSQFPSIISNCWKLFRSLSR